VTPDSILITGPAIIVDTLKYIPTEHWNIGEIKKDISKDIQLAQIPGITNSIQDVRVTLQLERFTEAQKSVPIKVIGLPDSLTIRLFPASVDVTYDVGLSMYDRVSDKDFNFIINYKDVGKSNFLPIQVTQSPSFIKNLAFSPQKVEYILEQK
jgi:YbbR domain-containing protein